MKRFVAIILLFPIFWSSAFAQELIKSAKDISGVSELTSKLPEDIAMISGDVDDKGMYDAGGAMKRFFENVFYQIREELSGNLKNFFSLVLISLICAMAGALCKDKVTADYIDIAGVCAVAAMLLWSMDGMVAEVVEALNQTRAYSKAAFPAVFMAAAAGGAMLGSSSKYAAVCLGLDIIMDIAQGLIIPLVYSYLALSLCKSLFTNPVIFTVQHFIKWLAGISLTAVTLLFSAYISICGAISSSADALAVKTARTIISNFLPVVGGMMSDAASTVLTAANMIKNSAGALSLVAVCALCAAPFVKLSVKMLLMRIASSACNMVPCAKVSGFINDITVALSFLLGLLGAVNIMLFISFMSLIKAVNI